MNLRPIVVILCALGFAACSKAEETKKDDQGARALEKGDTKRESTSAEAADRARFLEAMDDGAEKMCACKDVDCVGKTNDEIQAVKNPESAPTDEDQKRLTASAKKLGDCMKELTARLSPPAPASASASAGAH